MNIFKTFFGKKRDKTDESPKVIQDNFDPRVLEVARMASDQKESEKWGVNKEFLTLDNLIEELDFLENIYRNSSFRVVRDILINRITEQQDGVIKMLKNTDRTVREYIHSMIGNVAADILESGSCHVYRGMLDTVGHDLLEIYDKSIDFLLGMEIKGLNEEYATRQKETLRYNIERIG